MYDHHYIQLLLEIWNQDANKSFQHLFFLFWLIQLVFYVICLVQEALDFQFRLLRNQTSYLDLLLLALYLNLFLQQLLDLCQEIVHELQKLHHNYLRQTGTLICYSLFSESLLLQFFEHLCML